MHKQPLPQAQDLHPEAVFPLDDKALLERYGQEIADFLKGTQTKLAAMQARPVP
jgi:hypothetical protein